MRFDLAPYSHNIARSNRERPRKKYFERAKSLQKIDENRSFLQSREKLCLFFAHVIRTSGQVLVRVELTPYSHNIARNNREKPCTKYFEGAKSLQKFDENRDFFRSRQKLCLFFAHVIRTSGLVLVRVKLTPYSYNIARNNREKPRTNCFERTKTLQKFDENRDFFSKSTKTLLVLRARDSNKRASTGAC